jgi:hypothetical protein
MPSYGDENNKIIVDNLQKLLDYLEQEGMEEEFEQWMSDESEEAYALDFETWLQKRKEKENEGNNLPSGTDLS